MLSFFPICVSKINSQKNSTKHIPEQNYTIRKQLVHKQLFPLDFLSFFVYQRKLYIIFRNKFSRLANFSDSRGVRVRQILLYDIVAKNVF